LTARAVLEGFQKLVTRAKTSLERTHGIAGYQDRASEANWRHSKNISLG
jgi:hypothetical protein